MIFLKDIFNLKTRFLILLLLLFNACNITYKVRNQYNDIEQALHMPCGKIAIELVGKGNSKFVFKQKFDLDEKAIVYTDSLKIFYNKKPAHINWAGLVFSTNKLF